MKRLLSIVEDIFQIKDRGLIPVPGIVPREGERIKIGDPIQLRRPDGTSIRWRIGSIEIPNTPIPRNDVVILLSGLTKEDVPIGTEIWSDQDD